jgi:hypothetical protein
MSTYQNVIVHQGGTQYITGATASDSLGASQISVSGGTVVKAPVPGQRYLIQSGDGALDTFGLFQSGPSAAQSGPSATQSGPTQSGPPATQSGSSATQSGSSTTSSGSTSSAYIFQNVE